MGYFAKTKEERKIGSIVSIGLGKRFLSETEEGIAWGVINIHSEGKSSMNDEMIQSFTDVSRPILELLKDGIEQFERKVAERINSDNSLEYNNSKFPTLPR